MIKSVKFVPRCLAYYIHSLNIRNYFYLGDSSHGECPGRRIQKEMATNL